MKHIGKKIMSSISLILVMSMILPMFVGIEMQEVEAAKRLQGIQKIVNNLSTDKLTILEIVPDKAYASMGYYVSGYEPELDEKLILGMLSGEEIVDVEDNITTNDIGYNIRKSNVYNYLLPLVTDLNEDSETIVTLDDVFYQEQLYCGVGESGWSVVTAPEGTFFYDIREGAYVEAGNVISADYKYNKETGEFEYKPGEGDCVWYDAQNGNFEVVKFQTLYYKTNLTSNDWFAKNVLELGGALSSEIGEAKPGPVSDHNIEVITVTPGELEKRFSVSSGEAIQLKDIDLIYLSNSSCLALPDLKYATYDKSSTYLTENKNDISWETAYNIFEYIVNISLPVIVDDSITPQVITSNDKTMNEASSFLRPNNNIFRLAYLLKNYTEEYSQKGSGTYRYTIDQYKDKNPDSEDSDYRIPSELPADDPTTSEKDEHMEADLHLGYILSQAAGDYESYVAKLANKTDAVYASIWINASGKNIVNDSFNPIIDELEIIGVGAEDEEISKSAIYGVRAVVDDIYTENFYHNSASNDFTTEYQNDNKAVEISNPTLLKYILNFNNRKIEIYKDKIRVLDIEPTKYSELDEDTIRNWIEGVTSAKTQEIEIIQTTTTEFIGKIDDLNEEYDLIYFGSCVGNYTYNMYTGKYTASNGSIVLDDETGETNYNDDALDGMIYTHVGDQVNITDRAGGLLVDEYNYENNKPIELREEYIGTRYSGNDITETKVNQLMEYVLSGYPVVIADEFFEEVQDDEDEKISTRRVDQNSYMYEFMNTCVSQKYPNVFKESTGLASVMSDYINMPKLNLAMISQPDEYSIDENGTVNYLQPLSGRNILIYSFEFSNTLENNPATNYQVQLFVDVNADGQFDDSEELDSLDVMETTSLKYIEYDKLKPNVRYTVSRELPDDYVGIIPWQIKVSRVEYGQTDDGKTVKIKSSVRTSAEGYTAVKVVGDPIPVKILQIASLQMCYSSGNNYYYTGLILPHEYDEDDPEKDNRLGDDWYESDVDKIAVQYEKSAGPFGPTITDVVAPSQVQVKTNTEFAKLFNNLNTNMGFNIEVSVISVNDYIEEYEKHMLKAETNSSTTFYKEFFEKYDMIIMGFEDCYQDIASGEAVDAIDMFIKSGRSVLFSHDTTSYFNVNLDLYNASDEDTYEGHPWYHWGYHLNQYIRSDVGMDRYGVTESKLSILKGSSKEEVTDLNKSEWGTYITDAESINKEIPYYSGTETSGSKNSIAHEVHGFSDALIDEYRQAYSTNTYIGADAGTSNKSTTITQVNKGQITTYPYDINIEVGANSQLRKANGNYFEMNLPEKTVATTHAQYYQLDMNIDKDNDDSADMVVWYCLNGGRSAYFPNDVRNNYYIYSVGNVTYTGMGHTQYGNPTGEAVEGDEAKLFINTMIASLNSGKKNPSLNIISDKTNKNSSVNYLYRVFDQDEIATEDSDVDFYFYGTDVNIINGKKDILVEYYYEVSPKEDPAITIGTGDTAIYLRKIADDGGLASDSTSNSTSEIELIPNLAEVEPGDINRVRLKGEWVNAKMNAASEKGKQFRVYISAQTRLDTSLNEGEYTYTDVVFDSVTFKRRNLFSLD